MMQFSWLTTVVLVLLIKQASSQCSFSVLNQATSLYSTYTIQTPNYPSYYDINDACTWSITASTSSSRILFSIPNLSVERYYDFLNIYDGSSSSSSNLFYSRNSYYLEPTSVVTTGQNAYVTFTSDYSITYGGFQVGYTEVDSTSNKCTGSLTATGTKQHAWATTSSSFGCILTISATSGNFVKITVLNLVTSDYLRFADNDGSSSIDITTTGTSEYVSSTSTAKVTVPPITFSSFMFTYEEVASGTNNIVSTTTVGYGNDVCFETTLYATSTPVNITSPNYPSPYSTYTYCYTLIKALLTDKSVMITFNDYDVNYDDFLYIYDGSSTAYELLGSSWTAGQTVNSTGSDLYLSFSSGPTGTLRGFQLTYTEITREVPTCASSYTSYTASSTTQSIVQGAYSNNMDVYWLIVKPNATSNLVIDLSVMSVEEASECRYDSVSLYDGSCTTSPLIAAVCGYSPVTFEDTTGLYVLVRFQTDGSVVYNGFTLNYYIGSYASVQASTEEEDDDENTNTYFIIAIVTIFVVAFLIAATAVFCYMKRVKWRRTAIANGSLAAPKPKATKKSTHQLLSEINAKVNKDLENIHKTKTQRKTPRVGDYGHPAPAPPGPGVTVITRNMQPIHPTPGGMPAPVIQQGPPVMPPPFVDTKPSGPVHPPTYETGGNVNKDEMLNPAYPPGFNPAMYGKPVHIPEGTIPEAFQYITPNDARAYGLHQ